MGTRSDIIVHRADGTWARAYCHWDGYLEHNGRILFDYYTSQKQVDELISQGHMSSLAEKCSKPSGHTFEKPVKGYTVYYGRDRGETDQAALTGASLQAVWPEEETWTEFTYVWDDGKWWVLARTMAHWDCQRGNACDDYLRAVFPDRYEGFEL